KEVLAEIKPVEDEKEALEKLTKDKKEEEIEQVEKDKKEELNKKVDELKGKKDGILKEYGKDNKLVKQLIDLALLANNMLKGEDLNKFVKRSVELIKN
ncbi:MAG: molecular chaperone HtpG, partial [Bacteroidota bacterium]|nr:molecular chaperone HtpG [Bacteroidota bacterium]